MFILLISRIPVCFVLILVRFIVKVFTLLSIMTIVLLLTLGWPLRLLLSPLGYIASLYRVLAISDLLQSQSLLLLIDPFGAQMHLISSLFTSLGVTRPDILLSCIRAKIFHLLRIRALKSLWWRHFLLAWRILIYDWARVIICFELADKDHLLAI